MLEMLRVCLRSKVENSCRFGWNPPELEKENLAVSGIAITRSISHHPPTGRANFFNTTPRSPHSSCDRIHLQTQTSKVRAGGVATSGQHIGLPEGTRIAVGLSLVGIANQFSLRPTRANLHAGGRAMVNGSAKVENSNPFTQAKQHSHFTWESTQIYLIIEGTISA
ncbi:hypothetical protein H4Q26_005283 [Puccinia striiformis f. sp. tritici PST-130]|nr:hypothetical protein H4Q26_005283 [Puccinia striiformis f. sp. tritici PST-130]